MRRLVAVFALVAAACSPGGPSTTTVGPVTTTLPTTTRTAASSTTTPQTPVRFSTVELTDGERGWGITEDGRVLRTVDGGTGWIDVTPPGLPDVAVADFVADRAWVITGAGEVWIGGDGGATWERTAVPLEEGFTILDVAFADSERGWVLLAVPGGAGTIPNAVVATDDGGRSWRVVVVPPADADTVALQSGHSSGLAVTVGGRVWVTKEAGPRPEAWLAVSADGGRSWTERVVTVDGGEFCGTGSPVVDGIAFGAVIVECGDDGSFFAMTGDDGRTWEVAPLPGSAIGLILAEDGAVAWGRRLFQTIEPPGGWQTRWEFPAVPSSLSMPDAVHGLAVVGGELWRTDSGGASWEPVAAVTG